MWLCVQEHYVKKWQKRQKKFQTEKKVLYFENREALEDALDELILPGDSILVKASHFMQFEKIVKKLAE